jgi:D-xylose reductase
MPLLGLGVWQIPAEDTARVVYDAIKAGYRNIDTAAIYQNERQVGEGIRRAISEGLVTREDLFVTTKFLPIMGLEAVTSCMQQSLMLLGLDYLDLYHLHMPFHLTASQTAKESEEKPRFEIVRTPLCSMWRAMEDLLETGKVRHIGVCNVGVSLFRELVYTAKVKPFCLQLELNLFLQQQSLVRFAQEEGIVVTAFSPLGSTSYEDRLRAAGLDVPISPIQHPVVLELAQKYGKSPAQICLRHGVQRGITVLTRSTKPERIEENINVFDFEFDSDDMERLRGIDAYQRSCDIQRGWCQMFGVFLPIFDA